MPEPYALNFIYFITIQWWPQSQESDAADHKYFSVSSEQLHIMVHAAEPPGQSCQPEINIPMARQ